MSDQHEEPKSKWPECDFRKTRLSLTSQKQFSGIYDHVLKTGFVPKGKAALITTLLAPNIYDRDRGLYLPISDKLFLTGKLPDFSELDAALPISSPATPVWAAFFANPLTIPPGYEKVGFDPKTAAPPTLRLTNAGYLVLTAELDCDTTEEFEENLSWTRGRNDDFRQSLFAKIDAKLCESKDYRGYCIVFSGHRSLHFHFVFSTEHLRNCPWDATAEERRDAPQHALMARVHERYWDRVIEIFSETVGRSLRFDRSLRQATQWRRMPWAIRTLEKNAEILGIPQGARVPQIVVREDLRSRASRKASSFCIPETFSVSTPVVEPRRSTAQARAGDADLDPMLKEFQEVCATEWGPYPRPVFIKQQKGEWLFKFENNEADKNPSTIVLGGYRKLQINGKHHFEQEFYLPDDMTAQEWGNYLCDKYGRARLSAPGNGGKATSGEPSDVPISPFEAYKNRTKNRTKQPVIVQLGEGFSRSFSEPIGGSPEEMTKAYRRKLGPALVQARAITAPMIIKSGEGIGKTSALAGILAAEAFDDALQRVGRNKTSKQKFVAFAFRSRQQAEAKAEEFRESRSTVAIITFWEHLRIACEKLHVPRMMKDEFDSLSLPSILGEIERRDKRIYDLMEERRRSLWVDVEFDAGITLLTMTHKAAQAWPISWTTRAWHHPDFHPDADDAECKRLADEFQLNEIVFDDPEVDDFLLVLKGSTHDRIRDLQVQYPDWRNHSLVERRDIYSSLTFELKKELESFDNLDALIRLDLEGMGEYNIDFWKIPYGQDNGKSGIYKTRHGNSYFLGVKSWVTEKNIRLTFLTTEEILTDVITKALQGQIMKLDFSDLPGVYPIRVPIHFDPRAKSDRRNTRNISLLAAEIIQSNPNALVIADGVRDVDNVHSFQKMKGLNGLEGRDISVVLTWLAPEKYCELNVLGQWLGNDNIILDYVQDQINQAVGRNRGFRQSPVTPTTTIISTRGYYRKYWVSPSRPPASAVV